LLKEQSSEINLKNLEKGPTEYNFKAKEAIPVPRTAMTALLNEADVDTNLKSLERNRPPSKSYV